MTKKHSFWEISFYISLLLILIWLILKMTGIINTPPLLEYGFPILSALYAFFAIYRDLLDRIARISRSLIKVFMKVECHDKNIAEIKENLRLLRKK